MTTLDCKKLSIPADTKGKVVLLDFWATWCGPCVASMPHIKLLPIEITPILRDCSFLFGWVGHDLRMNDSITSLTQRIQDFVDAREWRQFHNAKDLSVAIAAEAGELMQHFVWQQERQIDERVAERREEIASEIADVGILLFELADNLGFQLGDVMAEKMARNEERYPVEKSRGNNLKYNQLG